MSGNGVGEREWTPTAPECPAFTMDTYPTPTSLAFSIAISMAVGPRMIANPLSASIIAVPGFSRTIDH